VGLGVRWILVLVEVKAAGLFTELRRLGDRSLRRTGGWTEVVLELEKVRPEQPERVTLLDGHLVRHRGLEPVAARVGDHRERDARVA
jgi:hypothetical protein